MEAKQRCLWCDWNRSLKWVHSLMSGKRASGQTAQYPKGCYFWPLAGIAPINPGRARGT